MRYLLNTPELADGISKALCTQNSFSYSPLHLVYHDVMFEYAQFIMESSYLSEKSIRESICLLDRDGNNVSILFLGQYTLIGSTQNKNLFKH